MPYRNLKECREPDLRERVHTLLQAGRVQRLHTAPTVGDPCTVSGHSWAVAILAFTLIPSRAVADRVALAALSHDLAEILTGDIPATAKWLSEGLSREIGNLEERFHAVYLDKYPLTVEEEAWLSLLDITELALYCQHQRALGNTLLQDVEARCLEKITERAARINGGYIVWELLKKPIETD